MSYQGEKLWYHQLLIDELVYTASLLKKHDIQFWLIAGSLLGASRDNRIIPWDDDIDIGIFLSDFDKLSALEAEVTSDGFKLKLSKRVSRLFFRKIESHPDIPVIKFHVDIFTYSVENDRATNIYNPRHFHPLSDLKELEEIEFEGAVYPCPKNREIHLARTYPNWKVPKTCKHDATYVESFAPENTDIVTEMKKYDVYKK
jgi:phosphorylcholine metabolism protein LicD